MCRLIGLTSKTPVSPMVAINALDVMKEGHDGSGVGLLLRDLGGPFAEMKESPILSGIFTEEGIRRLDLFMMDHGFMTKYKLTIKIPKKRLSNIPKRDVYLIRAYELPEEWEELDQDTIETRYMEIRLKIREMGKEKQDMIVFSFWPDTIMIKELGDPREVAEYLKFDREELKSGIILAQGRQNTNYEIDLYACHPFFLKGYSTMTNGENTAFIPIKNYLESRGFPGYTGYQSDSEVFTHILHYTMSYLELGLDFYKHVITPLRNNHIDKHHDALFLKHLKESCRKLIIDGPNCVIGALPDKTLFMAQDQKKLRPGVVGGKPGIFAFSSEICGLDAVIPDRDKNKDIQPMYMDTAIVSPDRKEVKICRQTDPLNLPL
ncbi:MAG: glutamate synthase [Desulfobacteraceae bacterium]|nr:glutamate synthase [Desulfobacteraceae bacterium]